MSSRQPRRFAPVFAWMMAIVLAFATTPGFGSSEKKESEEKPEKDKPSESAPQAEPTPAGTPKPQYSIGSELKGHYDLTTLLANERVAQYQYEIGDIRANIGRGNNWVIQLSIVLEFGNGSGIAESELDDIKLRQIIQTVLLDQSWQQLLTTGGKLRFSQQLISMFNGTLKTACVRQIYFSEICIARM